jgi:TolB-like protein
MRRLIRSVLAFAAVAVFAPTVVEAQGKPVIAVLYFDNNSIGKDRADFEGIGKGIADMLITDMAANPNVRIVERDRIQALITEQNLTKEKTIDPQTAIRLGKLIGAQYMITGGFMSDGRGAYILTARAVNVQTSEITNPTRLSSKGDDVLALIAQLSTKLNTDMKLPALQVGHAGMGHDMPAEKAVASPAEKAVAQAGIETKRDEAKVDADKSTKVASAANPSTRTAPAQPKMDVRTVMLYSKALEEEDAGNKTKAVELYRQVVDKFPDYAPAKQKISKLGG